MVLRMLNLSSRQRDHHCLAIMDINCQWGCPEGMPHLARLKSLGMAFQDFAARHVLEVNVQGVSGGHQMLVVHHLDESLQTITAHWLESVRAEGSI